MREAVVDAPFGIIESRVRTEHRDSRLGEIPEHPGFGMTGEHSFRPAEQDRVMAHDQFGFVVDRLLAVESVTVRHVMTRDTWASGSPQRRPTLSHASASAGAKSSSQPARSRTVVMASRPPVRLSRSKTDERESLRPITGAATGSLSAS